MTNSNLIRKGKTKLWKQVMSGLNEDPDKSQNGQMDVVTTLWTQNLIVIDRQAIHSLDVAVS